MEDEPASIQNIANSGSTEHVRLVANYWEPQGGPRGGGAVAGRRVILKEGEGEQRFKTSTHEFLSGDEGTQIHIGGGHESDGITGTAGRGSGDDGGAVNKGLKTSGGWRRGCEWTGTQGVGVEKSEVGAADRCLH